MTKVCTKCDIEKDLSEFYNEKSGKYGKQAHCKLCDNWRKTIYLRNKSTSNKCNTLDARENRKNGLKYCPRCKEIKKVEEFYKSQYNNGRCSYCILCSKEFYKMLNKEKEHTKKYYKRDKKKVRNKRLKSKFGITLKEYNKLLKKQKNKCAICGMTTEENGKSLAVDHNHMTNKIRELLCNNCNIAIGFINEDISIAKKLIKYLKKWS